MQIEAFEEIKMKEKSKKQEVKAEENKRRKAEHEEKKLESAVKDYYEAESWQFSGCGD